MRPLGLPGMGQEANQALSFILCPSSNPVFPPPPTLKTHHSELPSPVVACPGGQRGTNCSELEGLLLAERAVRCRVCGELGLQSAARMTQKLNIASDINRASHRANTGPPSPSADSHKHWAPRDPSPSPTLSPSIVPHRPPTPGTDDGFPWGTSHSRTNLWGPCTRLFSLGPEWPHQPWSLL